MLVVGGFFFAAMQQPNPVDHLGLVHYWAARYARRAQDHDDIFSMGVVGLLRACELFDPTRGTRFATYATYWIRQAITRGLKREQPTIGVPEKWTTDQRIPCTSLNRRVRGHDGEDGTELGDLLPGGTDHESPVDAADARDRVHRALRRLPRRDAEVLRLRHGIRDDGDAGHPMTLDEIARIFRVTRERVRQLELRATARLRRRLAG